MGTRARVGIVNVDGSVTSIYIHWDGYPDHHFPILTQNYATEEKVRALIALGDLSSLDKELGTKDSQHSFDKPHDGWCVSYARDRGEDDVAAVTHPANDWPDYGQDYEYLFSKGGWSWRKAGREWTTTAE